MAKYVDLHMHSTYSDGKLSVEELFQRATEKKLSAIVLTDHDTYSGYEEAMYYANKTGIETLIGSEISTWHNGKDVHVLAYGFSQTSRMLNSQLSRITDDRVVRAQKMCEKLNRLGISIAWDDVEEEAGNGSIARPHIGRVLVKMGVVPDLQTAFDRFLSDNAPAYVSKYRIPTQRAIEMIKSAGGVSVVAHIGRYFSMKRLEQFKGWGLNGIEVFHPSHQEELRFQLDTYATDNGLIKTGGSDFHEVCAYTDMGAQNVPYSYFETLKQTLKDSA